MESFVNYFQAPQTVNKAGDTERAATSHLLAHSFDSGKSGQVPALVIVVKCTSTLQHSDRAKACSRHCSDKGFSSGQFSHSGVSHSLQPHEPQHARPPCPSPTPGDYPSSCPLSLWCHPTISSSVVPFSSCPRSFSALGSFQISQLFTLSVQSIGVSASTSVLPMNPQDWSPLG